MQPETFEFDVEDVEYLRHGDKPLLARLFIPRGPGPFRSVVELHGGAWSQFDRTRGKTVHEALARSGVSVIALDFRQGEEGRYPMAPSLESTSAMDVRSSLGRPLLPPTGN